jgi:hypothetical protein
VTRLNRALIDWRTRVTPSFPPCPVVFLRVPLSLPRSTDLSAPPVRSGSSNNKSRLSAQARVG